MFNQCLAGQIALVTGGNSGIGKAIAEKFAHHGARVFLIGTNLERGHAVADLINGQCGEARAQFIQADVSKADEVDKAVKGVIEAEKTIDILVNNAGITRDQLLMKMTEEDWDAVLDINLKSCYFLCRALVRVMMKARRGRVINISSVVGLSGNAGQANYSASKAGMIGLTKALAKELAPRNILVNCIAPGFIETRMTDELNAEQKKALLDKIPLGRFGKPEEIADAALFLASDFASYMTGQILTVDGGMLI